MTTTLKPTEMQKAFYAHDADYDGLFFVGVTSTQIFCRPSCSARRPKPENVRYFPDVHDAMYAGFRACKRCHPLQAFGAQPAWVKALMDALDQSDDGRLRDYQMRALGVDPARARRYFHRYFGMTFQAYARAKRLGGALQDMRNGAKVDDIAIGRGYQSRSGFSEAMKKMTGSAPTQKSSTNNVAKTKTPTTINKTPDCIVTALVETPIGPFVTGANSDGIVLCEFSDRRMLEAQVDKLRRYFDCPIVPGDNAHLRALKKQMAEYFSGKRQNFDVPLVFPGTEFQQRVWQELLKIPYGQTIAYQELARRVGDANAMRAVGTANGMNRIAVVIPCHRVVNKSGALGGYGGGVQRKQWLLDLETRIAKK